MALSDYITSPRVTKYIRFILDECLPPIIRDQRWFYRPILWIYNRKYDPDFRMKAPSFTEADFKEAYEKIHPMRPTDMTPGMLAFVLRNLVGQSVLEVGTGNGDTALACAAKGFTVVATDLAESNIAYVKRKAEERQAALTCQQAALESLPFPDHSFDNVLCLHTLEHVLDLYRCICELKRVTKRRLIIIVPRERYYRYTCNYHLNFFGAPEQLILTMGIRNSHCEKIDDALCYYGDLNVQ